MIIGLKVIDAPENGYIVIGDLTLGLGEHLIDILGLDADDLIWALHKEQVIFIRDIPPQGE